MNLGDRKDLRRLRKRRQRVVNWLKGKRPARAPTCNKKANSRLRRLRFSSGRGRVAQVGRFPHSSLLSLPFLLVLSFLPF